MKQENGTHLFAVAAILALRYSEAGLRKAEAINVNKSEWRGVLRKKRGWKIIKEGWECIISSRARE